MDRTVVKALQIISISLGLAVIFNFLFFEKLVGISVVIFNAILLGTVWLLGIRQQVNVQKAWWLSVLILFFALMPGIRDNPFLTFLNVCAAFGLLLLLAHQLAGTPVFVMRLFDYFMLVFVPFRMLQSAASTLAHVSQAQSNVKHRDVWLRVLKGILMALPLLLAFGLLFSQADLAFGQFVERFVDIQISERTIQYTVLLTFAFVASLCFLSYIFFAQGSKILPGAQRDTAGNDGRSTEVLVALGLIAALFLLFIGFQVTYLFGGETNIINAGFTYAEYARRGFFELLAVVVLSLVTLLAAGKYSGNEAKRDTRFLAPALILTAEVVIIIVSAIKRLLLYIDAYGLTMLRFYAAGFIILLLTLFILLTVKFIASKKEEFFTFGTVLLVAAFLIMMNAINPDARIINFNTERYDRTGKVDASYPRELSADAMAGKINLHNKLEGEDKQILGDLLQKEKEKLERNSADWQSTNLSRTRALKLLQDF